MKDIKKIILPILLIYLVQTQTDKVANFVRLSQQRGAACLDGSPPGLYYHQGSQINKNKFMIYFDSGGFCGDTTLSKTLQSCYKRSSSSLGTTINYSDKKNFKGYGLLSPYQQENPLFFDWTKIFMVYCDGSQYQGNLQKPITYKDKNLYFRGKKNVMQQFRYMEQKFDFYNKDTIIMTGVSAGGIATYFWSNYLVQNTITSKVYAFPDSGMFLTDYYSPLAKQKLVRQRVIPLMNLVNGNQQFSIPQCIRDFNDDIVQCFNSANVAKYLKAPMFIIQSPYDQWSLQNSIGVPCLQNKDPPFSMNQCNDTIQQIVHEFRRLAIQNLKVLKNNRSDVGLWAPSCIQHGFSDSDSFNDQSYRVPQKIGITLVEAIKQFLANPNDAKWHLDQVEWPYNQGCNGIHSKNLRKKNRSFYHQKSLLDY